jgi:hypothetical protein
MTRGLSLGQISITGMSARGLHAYLILLSYLPLSSGKSVRNLEIKYIGFRSETVSTHIPEGAESCPRLHQVSVTYNPSVTS